MTRRVRVIDLDGSLATQNDVVALAGANWVPAQDWGLRIRLACRFETFERFQRWLSESLPSVETAVTLYGSGDFHHVTLALLRRIHEPFHLLVLDKHPDWMRGIPFVHCGTWLYHALGLPALRKVFLCGGEADFESAYRWLAPWPQIRSGRVVVFPARRRFLADGWARVPVQPLVSEGRSPAQVLREALGTYREELARYPLYVSIDKDVLHAHDAAVNWDSGFLSLGEVGAVVETFLAAAHGNLVGADLLGDWSPVRLGNWLSRLCARLDHPSPDLDTAEAARRNCRANLALLQALIPG